VNWSSHLYWELLFRTSFSDDDLGIPVPLHAQNGVAKAMSMH
jgi:hypothetical protein